MCAFGFQSTSAQCVVQLALREFGMGNVCTDSWGLTKVSVTAEGVIKQSRLPDQITNLVEKNDLNSR